MPQDIPQEQLDRMTPVVEELLARVREIAAKLPFEDEWALRFHPESEPEP